MALLADPGFHQETTMTLRQRLCFWSGFLYYFSTAINVFMAPLPVLIMIWLLPERIFAVNMLGLIGPLILWLVIYPMVFHGGWRIEVLRTQTIYSFAHALAIFDAFRGRTAEWIPTGTDQATPLAVTVRRIATVSGMHFQFSMGARSLVARGPTEEDDAFALEPEVSDDELKTVRASLALEIVAAPDILDDSRARRGMLHVALGAASEDEVFAFGPGDLRHAQTRLDRHQNKRVVAPPEPGAPVPWSGRR